jgi:hypothetical protein
MTRRRLFWIIGIGVLVLAYLAGQGGETAEVQASQACLDAMRQAASVNDMQDTVSDLYPALEACESLEAFAFASSEHPAALDGVDAETFARNACRSAPQAARDAPLCTSLAD